MALRITYGKLYDYPSSPLFHDIGIIPIDNLVEREIVKLLHNIKGILWILGVLGMKRVATNTNSKEFFDFDVQQQRKLKKRFRKLEVVMVPGECWHMHSYNSCKS